MKWLRTIAVLAVLASPIAGYWWPADGLRSRYLIYEDLCWPNPNNLACELRKRDDAALGAQGYMPRFYDPFEALPIMPTQ